MNAALRPRPMRLLGLALLVFTVSFSVLAMHQVTHPGEGHAPGVTAHEHRGQGLVVPVRAEHAGHGGHGSGSGGQDPAAASGDQVPAASGGHGPAAAPDPAAGSAPLPGDHHSSMTHLCLGLIVTVAGLLALFLLGWLRRGRTSTPAGLRARLIRTIPRAPPLRLFDLDSLCVLRL